MIRGVHSGVLADVIAVYRGVVRMVGSASVTMVVCVGNASLVVVPVCHSSQSMVYLSNAGGHSSVPARPAASSECSSSGGRRGAGSTAAVNAAAQT